MVKQAKVPTDPNISFTARNSGPPQCHESFRLQLSLPPHSAQAVCPGDEAKIFAAKLKWTEFSWNLRLTANAAEKNLTSEDVVMNMTCAEAAFQQCRHEDELHEAGKKELKHWHKKTAEKYFAVPAKQCVELKGRVLKKFECQVLAAMQKIQALPVMKTSWRAGVEQNASLAALAGKSKGSIGLKDVVMAVKENGEQINKDVSRV